ncbi:hypothetical protein Q7C30_006405 [Pseudomonas sp. RAC1]|uniref:hypothetical protein n=1 Tax=Pseudomonas sp. RAC1 TaxID=3064900 RepID=UPI0027284914|nr:hypothetical protein [Pseudomonas sp. RAC1]MDV9031729.1 hypothetical protein [Pseudomonas sp. RAC1]
MAWDSEEVGRHDKHQKATIGYALEVIKLLFVLSGGALATCSAFFSDKIGLPTTILHSARWAWVSLTIAIILFSIALLLVLARDYITGERWRKKIEEDEDWAISPWWDNSAWAFGLVGLAAFWSGMIAFAIAAWNYLGHVSIFLAPSLP